MNKYRFLSITFLLLLSILDINIGTTANIGSDRQTKTCYLLRHGITDWSWKMIPDGPQDLSIGNAGRAHIENCARFFKSLPHDKAVTEIFTSPLVRCKETAEIISKVLGNIPVQVVDNLCEIYHGDWSTNRKENVQEIVNEAMRKGLDDVSAKREVFMKVESIGKPADAESWENFKPRAIQGVEHCLRRSDDNMLIIGHGVLFKVFLESRKLYKKEDAYWTLDHRPPLVLEYSSVEDANSWEMTIIDLQQ